MSDGTAGAERVSYRLEPGVGEDGEAVGSSGRAGLAGFLAFVGQAGLERVLRERVRLPLQERRSGFTHEQKSLALVAAAFEHWLLGRER